MVKFSSSLLFVLLAISLSFSQSSAAETTLSATPTETKTASAKPDSVPATLEYVEMKLPKPVLVPTKCPPQVDSILSLARGAITDLLTPDSLALNKSEVIIRYSYVKRVAKIEKGYFKPGMEFGKLNPRGTAKASERLLTYELKIGIDGSRFYCDLKLLKNNLSPWQTSLQNQCPADSLSKSVTVPKK